MDDALHLAAVCGLSVRAQRVIGAAQLCDVAFSVLDDLIASDAVGVAEPHLTPGREPEELSRGVLSEVVSLDPQLSPEGDLAVASALIFRIVNSLNGL